MKRSTWVLVRHGLVAAVALSTVSALGCTDPEAPPPLSLEGPTRMAPLSTCLVGDAAPRLRVAPERCEGDEFAGQTRTIRDYAYISNQMGDSVAVASFNARPPALVDTAHGIPGVTHIPVGRVPQEIVSSADGNFVFVFNQADRDISVVSDDLHREIQRIRVGQGVSAMIAVEGRDALWILLADTEELVELTWTFTCDEEGVYLEGCQPQLRTEIEPLLEFPRGSTPLTLTAGPTPATLFVSYGARSVLTEVAVSDEAAEAPVECLDGGSVPCVVAEYGLTYGCSDGLDNDGDGLVDAADPQCGDPLAAEAPNGLGRGPVTACVDGIDNDGDGLIDAADGGCFDVLDDSEGGAMLANACSDGADNDGDGLIDADDPECNFAEAWTPNHGSEAARPACSDGLDNDGDGHVDLDDVECLDAEQDDEARQAFDVTECNDGLDNDGDGAVDLQDPGCDSPRSTNERFGTRPCNDGLDNDGDGFADYPADPDCYGSMGRTESSTQTPQFGPVAVDPGGLYAYVIDRTRSQLVIVDLVNHETLDANAEYPMTEGIGVAVGAMPTSVVARRRETEVATYEDPTTGAVMRLTQTLVYANVASTRGAIYYVEAGEVFRILDEEDQVIAEQATSLARLSDARGEVAEVSNPVTCDISDELVRRLGNGGTTERVTCESASVPRLLSPDGQVEAKVSPVRLAMRDFDEIAPFSDEEGDAHRPGELVASTVTRTEDVRILEDKWHVIYEGSVAVGDDVVIDQDDPQLLRSQGGDFCSAGVRPGDLLTVESPTTPLGGAPDCTAYVDSELTYRIAEVRSSMIMIAVLDAAERADLNRGPGALPVADVLPSRECFAAGITIRVRADDEWLVVGEASGLMVDETGVADICVPRTGLPTRTGRAQTGEVFENTYFSFRIAAGRVRPPQDFELSFSTRANFSPLLLRSGPSTSDMVEMATQSGTYLPVLDIGTNVVRVYDANSLELVTAFF